MIRVDFIAFPDDVDVRDDYEQLGVTKSPERDPRRIPAAIIIRCIWIVEIVHRSVFKSFQLIRSDQFKSKVIRQEL